MEQLKKRRIVFVIIMLSIITLSIVYSMWEKTLNKGKIILLGDAPFELEIYETRQSMNCKASPCEVVTKRGSKSLIIKKEGKETLIIEVKVPLWRTKTQEIFFKGIPYIKEVSEIPKGEDPIEFELLFDEKNGYYKLIEKESTSSGVIAYFQKEIKSPQIFGDKKMILVLDTEKNEAYKVDRALNSRTKIDGKIKSIENGKWDKKGKHFIFTNKESGHLVLINSENQIKETDLLAKNTQYEWGDEGLFFVTEQRTASEARSGKYGNYVSVGENITTEFSFGIYHPDEYSYEEIKSIKLDALPEKLVPTSNGRIVYFEIGETKYALHSE